MRAIKSIKQSIPENHDLTDMMDIFKDMMNHCIRIGLKHNCSTLKKLSLLSYHELRDYQIMSSYKICAISQACGRLSQRKRDIKKGKNVKPPFISKPFVTNCYSIKHNGSLLTIPFRYHNPINIILNNYAQKILSDKSLKIRSFTMTDDSISIAVSKEVDDIKCTNMLGIDRNLRNVTVGNNEMVTFYKTNKLLSIKQNTIYARAGFKRNDIRKKRDYYKSLQNRLQNRTKQFIHKISKDIVTNAVKSKSIIAFEDLKGIRKLYRKGNGQGNKYRKKMNSWQFYELQRQVQYKATWNGIPVVFVDPKRTSKLCPICGDRIQEDKQNRRKLLCINCGKSMDRDVIASMNIAHKAWSRFNHARGDTSEGQSSVFEEPMSESKPSNYDGVVIRILDVSKSGSRQPDITNQHLT
ncbi:MAG TPA: transposase [Nitrosarchaeum sp.]